MPNALPSAAYQTADELSELIRQRELAIDLLPEGHVKQRLAGDLAGLRNYAARGPLRAAPDGAPFAG